LKREKKKLSNANKQKICKLAKKAKTMVHNVILGNGNQSIGGLLVAAHNLTDVLI
jgi:hypothetical protein